MSKRTTHRLPPVGVVARALPLEWFAPAARPALTRGQHHGLHHVVSRRGLEAWVTAADRIDELCSWVARARAEGLPWSAHVSEVSVEDGQYRIAFESESGCHFRVVQAHPTHADPALLSTLPDDVRRVRWVPLFRGVDVPDPAAVSERAGQWVASEHRADGLVVVAPENMLQTFHDAAASSSARGFAVEVRTHAQWPEGDDTGRDLLWVGPAPGVGVLIDALQRRDVSYGTGARLLLAPRNSSEVLASVKAMLAACGRLGGALEQVEAWRSAHGGLDEGAIVEMAHHWALPRAVSQCLLRQAAA